MADANNADNVSVGKPLTSGGVYLAPKGTDLPTNATTDLPDAYVNLGFVSEDGMTKSIDTDSTEINEWGGNVIKRIRTSWGEQFQFVLIEGKEDVWKFVFGEENVKTDGEETVIYHNAGSDTEWVLVFEILLTNGGKKRIIVPQAVVIEQGDEVYKADEAIGYEVTVNANFFDGKNASYERVSKGAAA